LGKWGQAAPVLVVLDDNELVAGRSFRNIQRTTVRPVTAIGVLDVLGAASLLVSQAALEALTARAKGESAPADADAAPPAKDEAATAPTGEAA
jgi:large subunit ribosomal protein L4